MSKREDAILVSVILPVYNGEAFLEKTASSVISQTYKNIELIIVDDHSTDRSLEISNRLKELDKRISVFSNETNLGVLETRIKASRLARGEWIAFIDADDLWEPDKLEKQISLQKTTGCDLVYTASAFIDADGNNYDWIMHVPTEVSYRKLLKQNIISNSSVMLRKNDYLRFSPHEEREYDMHEDFACWLKMLKAGLVACGVDEPLISYRLSKKSVSSNKVKASKMNLNTYRHIGLNFFEICFYQVCYAFNGIKKYLHFKR